MDIPYKSLAGDERPDIELPRTLARLVTRDYLETMGIRTVLGSGFDSWPPPPQHVVVNETLRRRVFQSSDPIGKPLLLDLNGWKTFTVVGVVEDSRASLNISTIEEAYLPQAAMPVFWPMNVVIRTAGDPSMLFDAIRREMVAYERRSPAHRVVAMQDLIDQSMSSRHAVQVLMWLATLCTLLLTVFVVYVVTDSAVAASQPEMRLRSALGATPAMIWRAVLRDGARWLGTGLAAGLILSFATQSIARSRFASSVGADAYLVVLLSLAIVAFVPYALGAGSLTRRSSISDGGRRTAHP
jgi:putative ABC transport system permease protein